MPCRWLYSLTLPHMRKLVLQRLPLQTDLLPMFQCKRWLDLCTEMQMISEMNFTSILPPPQARMQARLIARRYCACQCLG